MTAPTDVTAEILRAEALIGVARFDEAITVLGRLVIAAPENAKALSLLAQCYGAQNRHQQMLQAADRAVAVAPQSEWAWRLRSTALRGLGQLRPALEAARQAVALGPHVWATHVTLTDVLLLSEQREARKEAYESAKRALEIAPSVPGAHNTMGRVLLSIGEHRLAQAHFEKAIALDPANSAAHTNLAITDLHKGRLTAASRRFGEVVADNPTVTSYVGNVNVAATAWIQRALDYVWLLCAIEMVVGLGLGLAYGPFIALGAVVLAAGLTVLSYRRLTKPIRVLIRRKAREPNHLIAGLLIAGLLAIATISVVAAAIAPDAGSDIVGPIVVWFAVAAIVRFYGRIQQRTQWISRRRKYSRFVLGEDRKAMVPRQRRTVD
jgi:tetratricopeptide (TPR) repeat protein